jgi:hypothetical protein
MKRCGGYRDGSQEGIMRAYYHPVEPAAPLPVQCRPATIDYKNISKSTNDAKKPLLNLRDFYPVCGLGLRL